MQTNPATVLRDFSSLFPLHIKDRGQEIFRHGQLSVPLFEHGSYYAEAFGTDTYDVSLVENELSCACPFFAENSYCKHTWALLLAIDNMHRGASAKQLPPAPPPSRRANWSQLLENAFRDEDLVHAFGQDSRFGEYLYYRLNVPYTSIHHALEIELYYRERKKNGELSVPKPARLRRADVDRLPNAQDRAILSEVLLVLPESSSWSSYSLNDLVKGNLFLSGPRMPAVAAQIAATGRFFIGSAFGKEAWQPVEWDTQKWELTLRAAEAGPEWVEGRMELRAGEEIIPLKKAIFLDQRLALYGNRLAELENPGAPSWLREALREQGIQIPRQQWPEFFSAINALQRRPVLQLAPGLQPEEVRAKPQPRLRLRVVSMKTAAEGILSFSYPFNPEVPDSDARFTLTQDAAQMLHYDVEAHEDARQQLRIAGLQQTNDPDTGQRLWSLALAKFPRAVRDLIQLGWLIEAEGRPIRFSTGTKVSVTTGIDWFDVDAVANFDEFSATLPELVEALQNKARYVRLGDGSIGLLPEEWIARYAALTRFGKEVDGSIRMKAPQAALLDALLEDKDDVTTDAAFQQIRGRLRAFKGIQISTQPQGFIGTMRPYQLEGLAWLQFLEEYGLGGCLADDMGVGKTIQMLAHLELRRQRRAAGEALPPDMVIVPRSLMFNWMAEAHRFTPQLKMLDYTGTARSRHEIPTVDVVLTTYGTLRRDVVDLRNFPFGTVVLDEAQAIKNASSDSAKSVRLINSRHRLAMTGTPVENHLGELWSLFEFLNPGLLGSSSLWKSGGQMDPESRDWLRRALRPLILRRTKQQVASDLPARNDQVLYCEMEAEQRKLYGALLLKVRKDLKQKIADSGLAKSKMHVLEALLRLRQVACHPKLVQPNTIATSAKFELLLEHLQEIVAEGHKALVFSQFTSLLALLKPELDAVNLRYEYLDGSTTDRQARVEHFQSDETCSLFLLSLKAGGTGLNLTAADYVFLLDPWWNPAVEAQAIDRTHRIGQVRPVFAYRLVARDTIEDRILELQQNKRDLAEAILSEDNSLLSQLRKEDLDYLLS